jgi:hypothetical protein
MTGQDQGDSSGTRKKATKANHPSAPYQQPEARRTRSSLPKATPSDAANISNALFIAPYSRENSQFARANPSYQPSQPSAPPELWQAHLPGVTCEPEYQPNGVPEGVHDLLSNILNLHLLIITSIHYVRSLPLQYFSQSNLPSSSIHFSRDSNYTSQTPVNSANNMAASSSSRAGFRSKGHNVQVITSGC